MNINLKRLRYVVPLILLPFLCLFFYVYKSSFGKEPPPTQQSGLLQENVADVSQEVKTRSLDDKLDAYKKQYKDGDGYTAVGVIDEEQARKEQMPDLYNQREKRMLDSIEQQMKRKYGSIGSVSGAGIADLRQANRPSTYSEDRELASVLSKLSQPAPIVGRERKAAAEADPMKLFKAQMALIDSMGKANDPEFKAEQARRKAIERIEKEAKAMAPLSVAKANRESELFNTITAENEEMPITAIVDQDITGYASSRLRIRLLNDIKAGKHIVKKGTYLYAQITGFSGQRVALSVQSIFQNGNILPVKLEVYDNDGSPGLYVPASAFREFSKELGNDGTQGLTLQQQAENNSQMVMSILQKMFQSTTAAVGKLIRSNKAKLKYNTIVYLIDPNELKKNQNNY